jgi:hypothetical protein
MHTYEALWKSDAELVVPDMESARFTSTLDVVTWAERDRTIGWATWPVVWHLDEEGKFNCYFKAFSLSSIRAWAEDPYELRQSRLEGLAGAGCADRWVIVDSRPRWFRPDEPTVTEADAAAFVKVRQYLTKIGVTLLDDVIFDDQHHWWSMRELVDGTLAW